MFGVVGVWGLGFRAWDAFFSNRTRAIQSRIRLGWFKGIVIRGLRFKGLGVQGLGV